MALPGPNGPRLPFNRYTEYSPVFVEIATQTLRNGAVAGVAGLIVGAGAGIMRSAPPALFGVVAGLQWFTLASTFTGYRGYLYHLWGGRETLSRADNVKASGLAGGAAGVVGGIFRGPRNILPGMLVFGAIGAGSAYLAAPIAEHVEEKDTTPKSSWMDSKWSPVKRLSHHQYAEMIEEKLLRLDAEIAIIDDNIAALKASEEVPNDS
ncbi:hypothetical protein F4780DRAFT_243058 [Xylariomycetidae sp. FL0641]|nr:hypothetical protein F4780DRAFT_243058 [Xylariomycetidae sp. FL0641]